MKVGVKADTSFLSSNVLYTDTNNIGATTVQGAIDKLKDKIPESLKLGDYFTLVPDASSFTVKEATTGYSSDQTITPNELTLWRIINIQSDGEVEAVSEYVSSKPVYFTGITGYANFVGGLQTIATSYVKVGYTTSTRMMGYGGQTALITGTYSFSGSTNSPPSTTDTPSPTIGTGREYTETSPGDIGDTLYLRDYNLVSNVYKSDTSTYGDSGLIAYKVGTTTETSYWLSSRFYYYYGASSGGFCFSGRIVGTSGKLSHSGLRHRGSVDVNNKWSDLGSSMGSSRALRPIITLKSGVTLAGGSGTKESPYTLG